MNYRIYLLLLFFFSINIVKASHVPGGNITYECIGNNQYVVTLTLYEDCGTAFESGGNQTIQIANDCGYTSLTSYSLPNIIYQQEVSQLCSSQLGQSECNGGTLPGVYMHQWQDTITLPAGCDSWTFSYSSCCRNTSTNLVGSSDNYYWEAVLNSNTAPCNTAPAITSQPIPYVCVNQNVTYSLGAYEPDGNTLVYSLINAMTSATGIVSYQTGYTGANPIPGITLNSSTGQIQFTPTSVGNYVVAVLIEEFDSNGNLVGSIVQDFQFEVINCAGNNNPVPPAAGISNFTGSGTQSGPTDIQVCEGDNFCFQLSFTDDATDSVYLTSNVATVLPGATFTQLTYFSPATAEICWTAVPGANPFSTISVNAQDNSCPTVGMSNMTIGVSVISSTYAGADETMCLGEGVQLSASGGSNFSWSVISGQPMNPTNFSCNNCQSPVANPNQTTVYQVTSNLSGGCTNVDTVTVNVVPDFTYTLSQSSTSTCLNSDIQLNIQPTPTGTYTYNWTPGTYMNNTTIPNPTLSPTAPGTYNYNVEITSAAGCIKYDSVSVNVAAAYAPDVTVTLDTSLITCGDSVQMTVDLGCGVPGLSGPSNGNISCSAPVDTDINQSACGSNTSTSYPSPYSNWYRNAKHQFLFPASELNAAGLLGGQINQIAWEVTTINGTTTYNSYSIKIGTTASTSLTTWETGLTQVFGPTNITIATGWNTHTFSTPYLWDGISNIVVEICYDNLATSYTSNSITPWECKSYNAAIYYRSDATAACPYTGTPTTSTNRPVTRFNTSLVAPDPTTYTFQWPTGSGVDNPTSQNVSAGPVVTTDYQLVVTNTNGGCTDTVNVHVDVNCGSCIPPIPTLTDITCNGGNDGEIHAQAIGANGPPWILALYDNSNALITSDSNVVSTYDFTGLTAGTYTVRCTDTTGCFADTVVTLNEPTPVTISQSNDTIICLGGSATLIANATGGNGIPYSYSWNGLAGTGNSQTVNPSTVTTYSVSATDAMGCPSDTAQIIVNLFPPILLTPSANDTVCPGEQGSVSVSANGGIGGTYFYSWADGQGNVVGTSSTLTIAPTMSPTTYYVTVTDNCETPASVDSVTIYWYQEPSVSFTSDNVEGCYPVEVNFTNTTDTNYVSTCSWNFGDGNTSTTCGTVANSYSIPGSYDVMLTVTSPDGCTADTTYTNYINVYDYPVANFGSDPNPTDVLHPDVQFTDSSSSDVTSFAWLFGENGVLGTSGDQDPTFTFPDGQPYTYPVELIVMNQHGCSDSIVKYVVINGVFNFYVPNSFTPNGDGINDYFFPLGESASAEDYHFYVFNRWGEKIFESTQLDGKWDGTYANQPVEDGVYIWKIQVMNSITDEYYEYTGQVTLFR